MTAGSAMAASDFQAAAAVWTVLNGDLEDALEQACPTMWVGVEPCAV